MRQLVLPSPVTPATYYVDLGGEFDQAALGSVQVVHDNTVVASVAFEASSVLGLALDAAAAAGWSSISSAVATVTIAGGTAGTTLRQIVDQGAARIRAVVTVTTGGVLSIYSHAKGG